MTIIMKKREEAKELIAMRSLHHRMTISEKDNKRYANIVKGFEGEKRFDQLTEALQADIYLLHDICLEQNHSVFQIDTLLISEKEIVLFEIKNYEGDFVYESGTFRIHSTNQEILNPLHQLNRSVTLLRSLMKRMTSNMTVKGYLVFINPEFTLFQAPVDAPIILPSQLKRFMESIDKTPSVLSREHRHLAEHLLQMHLPHSPYAREPHFQYQHLQKGILCLLCHSHMIRKNVCKTVCEKCGYAEGLDASIIRSTEELKLLFPDMRVTTPLVQEWCKIIDSPKTIRRVLAQNFTQKGSKKQRYYVDKL